MVNRYPGIFRLVASTLSILGALGLRPLCASASLQVGAASDSAPTLTWQSPARLHHALRTVRGTLIFSERGIEFRSEQRFSYRWPYVEIQTVDVTPQRFVLISYENRGSHLPGDRGFRFDLSQTMPPSVAAEITRRVAKPVRNGEPVPSEESFTTIPARHTTRTGGSNGTLRFRDDGIDYLSTSKNDGRSWRWSDIQTLANPDPFHFRVTAYRETYELELKEPMSKELFDKLWDYVYARDIDNKSMNGGKHQ